MSHTVSFSARTASLSALLAASVLAGCASVSPMYSQDTLPESVKVPAGHRVAMQTVGIGEITYECRTKKEMAGQFEWTFVGPDAVLNDRAGMKVGKYYGPPATWESADGSKVTGAQVAVAPAGPANIPHQLVKANPASGNGMMNGISYIQRVATVGGIAPPTTCDSGKVGVKQNVRYQADYIFWKAS